MQVISGSIPIDKFIISQSISKRGYENTNSAGQKSASLGHVKLAQRMERRDPGTGPVSGDRVQFVVVREAPHLVHVRDRTIDGVVYAAKDWPPRHERCEDPVFVKQVLFVWVKTKVSKRGKNEGGVGGASEGKQDRQRVRLGTQRRGGKEGRELLEQVCIGEREEESTACVCVCVCNCTSVRARDLKPYSTTCRHTSIHTRART